LFTSIIAYGSEINSCGDNLLGGIRKHHRRERKKRTTTTTTTSDPQLRVNFIDSS